MAAAEDIRDALLFVEEQTAALELARTEEWSPDAVESIASERDSVAEVLRRHGHGAAVDEAICRGRKASMSNTRTTNKKRSPKKAKKPRKGKGAKPKAKKIKWKKETSPEGRTIWSAPIRPDLDVEIVVGETPDGGWVVGLYHEPTDQLTIYPDMVFRDAKAAKIEIEALLSATMEDVRHMEARAANREVGDVVLVAEQYFSAQQEELDLMKRGTPDELKRARERTKKAKEALEDMTGANRELYGAMGGGTLGAALGALTGNVFAAAIGALAGSVVGSVIARPSLPSEAPEALEDDDRRRGIRDEQVIPFPRRPAPRGRGYAANAEAKRRLTEL